MPSLAGDILSVHAEESPDGEIAAASMPAARGDALVAAEMSSAIRRPIVLRKSVGRSIQSRGDAASRCLGRCSRFAIQPFHVKHSAD